VRLAVERSPQCLSRLLCAMGGGTAPSRGESSGPAGFVRDTVDHCLSLRASHLGRIRHETPPSRAQGIPSPENAEPDGTGQSSPACRSRAGRPGEPASACTYSALTLGPDAKGHKPAISCGLRCTASFPVPSTALTTRTFADGHCGTWPRHLRARFQRIDSEKWLPTGAHQRRLFGISGVHFVERLPDRAIRHSPVHHPAGTFRQTAAWPAGAVPLGM
jgi:hypothetical protein